MENPDRNLRKAMPVAVLAIVAFSVALFGYLRADPAPDRDRVYLRNAGGPVLFAHADHADAAGSCVRCHHELAGEVETGCSDCHDDGFEADMLAHEELVAIAGHECSGCHAVVASEQAIGCRDCHTAAADGGPAFVGCDGCHDGYEPGMLAHAELTGIDGHACGDCHNARSVSDAYHDQCNTCHLEQQPARFAAADGRARCSACHLE